MTLRNNAMPEGACLKHPVKREQQRCKHMHTSQKPSFPAPTNLARPMRCAYCSLILLVGLVAGSQHGMVGVDSNGTILINAALPGADVILGNFSFMKLQSELSSALETQQALVASVSKIQDENEQVSSKILGLSSTHHVLSNENAALSTIAASASATILTLQRELSTIISADSICSYGQSPRILRAQYSSFASFEWHDTTYIVALSNAEFSLMTWIPDTKSLSRKSLLSFSGSTMGRISAFRVNNIQYVAIPYYSDSLTSNLRCELFVFDDTNQSLLSAQNISTYGVVGVASTRIGDFTYLAVSNYYNDSSASRTTYSSILRFNNASGAFQPHQLIITSGAEPPEFFTINGDTYLTIANNYDGVTHSLISVILKYSMSSSSFEYFRGVPTEGGRQLLFMTSNNLHYLLVTNYFSGIIDVHVYDGMLQKLLNFADNATSLALPLANAATTATINGDMYFIVAPSEGGAAIVYILNTLTSSFDIFQRIPVPAREIRPLVVKVGYDTLLFLDERMYAWCDGSFVLT
jgi:hypothetical protein